MRYFKLWKLPD